MKSCFHVKEKKNYVGEKNSRNNCSQDKTASNTGSQRVARRLLYYPNCWRGSINNNLLTRLKKNPSQKKVNIKLGAWVGLPICRRHWHLSPIANMQKNVCLPLSKNRLGSFAVNRSPSPSLHPTKTECIQPNLHFYEFLPWVLLRFTPQKRVESEGDNRPRKKFTQCLVVFSPKFSLRSEEKKSGRID